MNKRTIIPTLLLILTTGLLFITTSCCTLKHCPDNYFMVEFYNFIPDDIDTVILCRYTKNTNYSDLADSTKQEVYQSYGADYYNLAIETIEHSFDYKIYVLSLGKVYKISDIETKKESCNSCFFIIPSDKYTRIKGYQLDGQYKSGARAQLYK